LKPVSLSGGRVFAGSTRLIPISYNYGYNLFNGDVVGISGGTLAVTALGAASSVSSGAGAIGVFVGAQYVNSMSQTVRAQFYAANTATNGGAYGPNSQQGYVVDDPFAVFQSAVLTQGTSSVSNTPGSTIGYVNPSFIGSNMYLVTQGSNGGSASGNTTTGDSTAGVALAASAISQSSGTATNPLTSGAPFRCVGIVPDTGVSVVQAATSSSTTITLSGANSSIWPGMAVTGPGITAGSNTYVTAVNGTAVTINTAVASAQSTAANFTFTGYPEVLVTWNFGFHSYFNATGV